MKKRKGNKKVIAIAVLSAILVLLLAVVVWLEVFYKGNQSSNVLAGQARMEPADVPETQASEPEQLPQNATVQSEQNMEYNPCMIQTPYVQLYFDEAFEDLLGVVHTKGSPYQLEFYAILEEKPEQRLFDITIGEGADGNLGAIHSQQGIVPVGMTIYGFTPDDSWNEGEITTVLAMQEVANDLIQQLMKYQAMDGYDGPTVSDELPESTWVEYLLIQTPYMPLRYPAVWNEFLLVEEQEAEDYSVQFYGKLEDQEPILLFSVIFGGDRGDQVGALPLGEDNFVTVNLLLEELCLDGVTDAQAQTLYSMQEDSNVLIENLENFLK